jgi:hypothetical protein
VIGEFMETIMKRLENVAWKKSKRRRPGSGGNLKESLPGWVDA